uniref:ABC transporter domain-containing protein n=4 Tax=Chrysotila carterae TaxID=13221 RepID=A0A7S4BWS6_CHRCT
MLLLDEATSALDAESEHVVQEAIDRLMAERTTVVVAHRLSTVRGADCICVVSKGKIIERGRHEDLIAQDGLYKKLVQRQMAGKHSRSTDSIAACSDADVQSAAS